MNIGAPFGTVSVDRAFAVFRGDRASASADCDGIICIGGCTGVVEFDETCVVAGFGLCGDALGGSGGVDLRGCGLGLGAGGMSAVGGRALRRRGASRCRPVAGVGKRWTTATGPYTGGSERHEASCRKLDPLAVTAGTLLATQSAPFIPIGVSVLRRGFHQVRSVLWRSAALLDRLCPCPSLRPLRRLLLRSLSSVFRVS